MVDEPNLKEGQWFRPYADLKKPVKLIFLDCDGVINSHGTFVTHRDNRNMSLWPVDLKLLAELWRVLDATGAYVVISSAWRLHPKAMGRVRSGVRRHGEVIGSTPYLHRVNRHEEISQWLKEWDAPKGQIAYAVIDDDVWAAGDHPYFQTYMKTGLTAEVADQVIKHLI